MSGNDHRSFVRYIVVLERICIQTSDMPGCAAVGCNNRSEKGYIMKCFPRDTKLRKIWQERVGRADWVPSNNSFLCHVHFKPQEWCITQTGRIKLKKDAVPSIFTVTSTRKSPKKRKKVIDLEEVDDGESLYSFQYPENDPEYSSGSVQTDDRISNPEVPLAAVLVEAQLKDTSERSSAARYCRNTEVAKSGSRGEYDEDDWEAFEVGAQTEKRISHMDDNEDFYDEIEEKLKLICQGGLSVCQDADTEKLQVERKEKKGEVYGDGEIETGRSVRNEIGQILADDNRNVEIIFGVESEDERKEKGVVDENSLADKGVTNQWMASLRLPESPGGYDQASAGRKFYNEDIEQNFGKEEVHVIPNMRAAMKRKRRTRKEIMRSIKKSMGSSGTDEGPWRNAVNDVSGVVSKKSSHVTARQNDLDKIEEKPYAATFKIKVTGRPADVTDIIQEVISLSAADPRTAGTFENHSYVHNEMDAASLTSVITVRDRTEKVGRTIFAHASEEADDADHITDVDGYNDNREDHHGSDSGSDSDSDDDDDDDDDEDDYNDNDNDNDNGNIGNDDDYGENEDVEAAAAEVEEEEEDEDEDEKEEEGNFTDEDIDDANKVNNKENKNIVKHSYGGGGGDRMINLCEENDRRNFRFRKIRDKRKCSRLYGQADTVAMLREESMMIDGRLSRVRSEMTLAELRQKLDTQEEVIDKLTDQLIAYKNLEDDLTKRDTMLQAKTREVDIIMEKLEKTSKTSQTVSSGLGSSRKTLESRQRLIEDLSNRITFIEEINKKVMKTVTLESQQKRKLEGQLKQRDERIKELNWKLEKASKFLERAEKNANTYRKKMLNMQTMMRRKKILDERMTRFNELMLAIDGNSKGEELPESVVIVALEIRESCGTKGYQKLRDYGFPLPAVTALERSTKARRSMTAAFPGGSGRLPDSVGRGSACSSGTTDAESNRAVAKREADFDAGPIAETATGTVQDIFNESNDGDLSTNELREHFILQLTQLNAAVM